MPKTSPGGPRAAAASKPGAWAAGPGTSVARCCGHPCLMLLAVQRVCIESVPSTVISCMWLSVETGVKLSFRGPLPPAAWAPSPLERSSALVSARRCLLSVAFLHCRGPIHQQHGRGPLPSVHCSLSCADRCISSGWAGRAGHAETAQAGSHGFREPLCAEHARTAGGCEDGEGAAFWC